MRQLSVGLLGYGFASSVFHAPLISAIPGLKLERVASSNPQAVLRDYPAARVDADSSAIFADPAIDLVVIATPNTSHFPLAREALLAGKHVVVDKPFVISVAEGRELIALATERGLQLSVFHNRRWDNDFLTVRRCMDSGLLGQVYNYESHFDRFVPGVDGRWREQPAPGAGVLFDLGSHLIDQALCLFGKPLSVLADIGTQRPQAQVDDYFHLLLDYGSLKVVLCSSMLVREPGPRFQVHGAEGSFIKYGLDSQEAALLRGEGPGHPQWGQDDSACYGKLSFEANGLQLNAEVETARGSYEAYYQGMYEAIVEGKAAPVSPQEALDVITVIEGAMRSHQEQSTIVFEWEGEK
ncbi:oxidoreductase [Oxalobacteraceae bacterium]|nr:oxidoreductase [Oxalobacteraceae bacterium]